MPYIRNGILKMLIDADGWEDRTTERGRGYLENTVQE